MPVELNPPMQKPTKSFVLTGWHVFAMLVAFFAVIIAVNFTMMNLAISMKFSSDSTFIRAFRRKFGLTPGELRELADTWLRETGAVPAILIVQPAHGDGLTRLRAAGAWFALDPQAVAACFSRSTATRPEGSGA